MKVNYLYIMFLILIFYPELTKAQSHLSEQVSATNLGLATTAGSLPSEFSTLLNPSASTFLSSPSFGITYQALVTGTSLSLKAVSFVLPFERKTIGLGFIQQGDTHYKEEFLGVNYSHKLSNTISVGIRFGCQFYHFSEEGSNRALYSFSAGILYLKQNFCFGIYSNNIISSAIETLNSTVQLSRYVHCTIYYDLAVNCKLLSRFSYYAESAFSSAFAIEYNLKESLFIRIGVRGGPLKPSVGFGYLWKNLECNLAVDYHQALGVSPSISMSYRFPNLKTK